MPGRPEAALASPPRGGHGASKRLGELPTGVEEDAEGRVDVSARGAIMRLAQDACNTNDEVGCDVERVLDAKLRANLTPELAPCLMDAAGGWNVHGVPEVPSGLVREGRVRSYLQRKALGSGSVAENRGCVSSSGELRRDTCGPGSNFVTGHGRSKAEVE